jgi:hypothetical protein
MKLFHIKRKTKTESIHSIRMGVLTTRVIYITQYFLSIPIRVLHKYRETYYGEIKDYEDCNLFI